MMFLKKYCPFILLVLLVTSCGEEDFVEYADGGTQNIVDPYLQIITSVVPFQAGVPSYDLAVDVLNGDKELSSIDIYSQFTDAVTQAQSEKILFDSFDVGDLKSSFTSVIDYSMLKDGITVNGSGLPDETELAIGSGWVLSFVGNLASGGEIPLAGVVNVGVLSPYAGLYEVIESDYYRIGVQSGIADWTGQERFIGSVDATTYSYNDWWGPFGWGGESFNFSVDDETGEITCPILVDGSLFSGNREVGCHTEPEIFVNVPCVGSNTLVKDPANPNGSDGAHEITITYGYFTDGSGPREFYEKLRKKS